MVFKVFLHLELTVLYHPLEDTELVKRLQSGEIEAFDLIYEKYSGKLYSFAMKYLRSEDESEELVQNVFLKIWETHKHLNKDLSFKSYIFTIAYNNICKFFRRRNYMQKFFNEEIARNSAWSSTTEQGIDFQSVLSRVDQIIKSLPDKQKIIFQKSRQEGKTSKEIALELNLSPGTVDNYISAAIGYIKAHLKNEDLTLILILIGSLFIM